MSITYEEALATLQSMFAEPWTRDTLDEVLRNQKGHMENTVDLLLRHGDKDPQILVDQLEAGIDPVQSAAATDEALARQLSQQTLRPAAAAAGKGKPTTLPDDFLRVPGRAPATNNMSDDEALARMLQDELFTEELSRNPDFAHLARDTRGRSNAVRSGQRSSSSASASTVQSNPFANFASRFAINNASNNNDSTPQSPNIMEKVSVMGESAKRRLQLMAAQFNAANGNGMAGGGNGAAASHEVRGLLDDDDNDNMELAARKDL